MKQGRLELPADFCFTSLNEELFLQMKEKTLEEVQKYEKQKKEVEQEKEIEKGKTKIKKKNEKHVWSFFPLLFSAGYINISSDY